MPTREATLARLRLRHLQCFAAVVEHGNLRRAAQALAITQPAVTKTLNELEELLGAALFVRDRRGATLTAQAQAFLPHALATLRTLAEAVDSVRGAPAAAPLRVGVLPTVGPALLPAIVRRHPSLQVVTARNAALIAALRAGEVDAVIGRLADPETMAGLSFEHLYTEPVVIVVRPGHPLRGARNARGLAAWPVVLPPAGTLIRQVADGWLARQPAPAGPRVETLDVAIARALVLAGDHLWFTPIGAVEADLRAGTLARLPARLTPHEAVGLILRPGDTPALTAFVAAVRAAVPKRRRPDR